MNQYHLNYYQKSHCNAPDFEAEDYCEANSKEEASRIFAERIGRNAIIDVENDEVYDADVDPKDLIEAIEEVKE